MSEGFVSPMRQRGILLSLADASGWCGCSFDPGDSKAPASSASGFGATDRGQLLLDGDSSMKYGFSLAALTLMFLAPESLQARRGRGFRDNAAFRNGWLFSLEQGKAEARRSGKPLMVVVRCVP